MMNTSLKLASLLGAACIWLSGCASAPQLGRADTGGFNAAGKTVLVDYMLPVDKDSTAKEQTELRDKRLGEVHQLLQQHGFRAVSGGASTFTIRVVEGAANEVTGDWKGAVGANLVIFTLGIVPAMFDYRSEFRYELWAGETRIHQITTPANWVSCDSRLDAVWITRCGLSGSRCSSILCRSCDCSSLTTSRVSMKKR